MTLPDGTQMASAGLLLTNAYNSFPLLATILAIIVMVKAAPIILRLVRKALPG